MNTPPVCPNCSMPLPTDAPEGLCPECVLKAAFVSQTVIPCESSGTDVEDSNSFPISVPAAGMRVKYFGDYELLEEIARGGMGVVWKARQHSLHRTVAIKMILAGKLADSAEVQRFLREAEAAANLQHPNIVAIHEVGEYEGQHYFSMDYIEGHDLAWFVREGAMPAQRAVRYVKTIAEAIHFAHQRGTLHRDLKPQNVLIDGTDQPRITDFGLAKIGERDSGLTQTGAVMGSPSYMAPEQAAGRRDQVGPHSDVYALGAILYELLTGRPPFRGATAIATLREVVESDPIPPRKLIADVPIDPETICLKCLEKAPELRYHSARELAEDLGRFLNHEPILARPAGTVRKVISWTRRHPLTLAGTAALLIIGLVFFTFQLIEENAFLRAQQTTPGLTRQPDPLGDSLESWRNAGTFVFLVAMYLIVYLRMRNLGSWNDVFDPVKVVVPQKPLGSSRRLIVAVLGLGCVGFGVVFLAAIIHTQVWEGGVRWNELMIDYAAVWFGLNAVWLAARDYQRSVFGTPTRDLSAEQLAAIREATMEFDVPEAIRRYRRAVPDAGLVEAHEFVTQLAVELQRTEPARFTTPSLSLRNLNWQAMALCALIEVAALGVFVTMIPASRSLRFACDLAAPICLGVGIMAGMRLKGFWKRMLAIVPAIILAILAPAMPTPPVPLSADFRLMMVGMSAGGALMMSAYTKDRRRKPSSNISNFSIPK